MFREGGHGVFAGGKLPAGLAGTFDVALAGDMVRAADMALAVDMARAAATVHTERGQRGTGGGAAVGETFTGAGAGAMTYLIFRRLYYGSI